MTQNVKMSKKPHAQSNQKHTKTHSMMDQLTNRLTNKVTYSHVRLKSGVFFTEKLTFDHKKFDHKSFV